MLFRSHGGYISSQGNFRAKLDHLWDLTHLEVRRHIVGVTGLQRAFSLRNHLAERIVCVLKVVQVLVVLNRSGYHWTVETLLGRWKRSFELGSLLLRRR